MTGQIKPRIWKASWMITAVFILSNSPTPLYIRWQRKIDFSSGMLTIIFAAYIISLLATLLIAGQLSSKWGRKPVLYAGLLSAIISSILFLVANSVLLLFIARLLSGIAVGVIVSVGMATVSIVGGESQRRYSALIASSSMVLGAGLGPLFSGLIAQLVKNAIPFIFISELILLLTAFWTSSQIQTEQTPLIKAPLRLPSIPRENRQHLLYGILAFGPGITATSFVLSLGPSLLSKLLGISSPLIAGSMACIMFLFATGIQFLVKKMSLKSILMCSFLNTTLSMLMLGFSVHYAVAILLVFAALFAGMGQGLGQLGGLSLIGLNMQDSHKAEANALLNMGGYVPAGLFPVLTGFLIDFQGLQAGSLFFAAIILTSAIAGAIYVRNHLSN